MLGGWQRHQENGLSFSAVGITLWESLWWKEVGELGSCQYVYWPRIILWHAEWRSVSPVVYFALQQEVGVTYSSRHYNPGTREMKQEDQRFQVRFQGNLGCMRTVSRRQSERERDVGRGVSTGEDSRLGDCTTSRSSTSARICTCQL